MIRIVVLAILYIFLGFQGTAQPLDIDAKLKSSAIVGCAANVSPPVPRSRALADAIKVLPPTRGAYLGAYQIPAQPSEAARFANATGRMPPIIFSFHDFFADSNGGRVPDRRITGVMEGEGSLPPLELARWLDERGSVLALAWAIYCCDIEKMTFWLRMKKPHDHVNRLLRGEHDDFLRESARAIRAYGRPIMLTLVPEMNWQGQFLFGADGRRWIDAVDNICNQYGDPTWPDGPERLRDLHMRVVDLFRQEGVTNVTWFMYSGNQYMVPGVEGQSRWLHPKYYYPGDAYVDWVGQSVYFTRPEWVGNYADAGTFEAVFLPGYEAWRSVASKPMLLPEFGILSKLGADRRDLWLQVLGDKLQALSGVRAVTVADSFLFQSYFDIPLLSTNAAELDVIRQVAGPKTYFAQPLRVGRP
jgi:hypothetical protein